MADVYFALLGQHQNVPFVVIKHDPGEAIPLEIPDDKPIHGESMQKTGSKADTRQLQNELVRGHEDWKAVLPKLKYSRPSTTIAYIGRLNAERWKKGGILKSGHLITHSLRSLGHRVIPVEIEQTKDNIIASLKDAQVVWIYPGDPQRPDFKDVEVIIEDAAGKGKHVFVNLSFNLATERNKWIVSRIAHWRKHYGNRIKVCLFTYGALMHPDLEEIREHLVCVPKTIDFEKRNRACFEKTSGIFLGDLQKLLNEKLVGGKIEEWIEALRRELPSVPLYAVRQYGGKIDRELGLEIVPYTKGQEWTNWLAARRIATCLTPHATFEMIPIECAGLGIPVVYRPMIQSHTEAISVSGIQVRNPKEFAAACKALYMDPLLWDRYSTAGHYRALSQHIDYMAAAIHQQIVLGTLQ